MSDPSSVIVAENLSYSYMTGTPFEHQALKEVSFTVNAGEAVGIVGATGSGKSTLIQLFNGLLRPDRGSLQVCGLDALQKVSLAEIRSQVGLLFQFPEHQLFDETVFADVCFGPRNLGLDEEQVKQRAESALHLVGLDPHFYGKRSPFALSGGEKRRAALAGVLAMEPRCLVLDEPTAGLDPAGARSLIELLKKLRAERGLTLIVVSHRFNELAQFAERLLVMADGRLCADGKLHDILYNQELLQRCAIEPPEICNFFLELRSSGLIQDDVASWPLFANEALQYIKSL